MVEFKLPLTKLPLTVSTCILRQLELHKVIHLFLFNRVFRHFVKMCKYRVGTISLITDNRPNNLTIAVDNEEVSIIIVENRRGRTRSYARQPPFTVMLIKEPRRISTEVSADFGLPYWKSNIGGLDVICQHLLPALLHTDAEVMCSGNEELDKLFFWEHFRKFSSLEFFFRERPPIEITSNRLKYILEEVDIDRLDLNVTIKDDPNFKYHNKRPNKGIVRIKLLIIRQSDWVDHEHLLDNFNAGAIDCPIPSLEVVNKILKSWIDGEHANVDEVRLEGVQMAYELPAEERGPHIEPRLTPGWRFRHPEPLRVNEEIFNGIEKTETAHIDLEFEFLTSYFYEGRKGFGIRRKSDGKLAVIWIAKNQMVMKVIR